MSKLGDIAKKTVGATTVKIDDIIRDYNGVVTVNGLSYADYKGDRVPVFSFVEGEGLSFWGGCKKLREMSDAWIEELGDLRTVNDELAVEGVKIKLSPTIRTKSGNPFRPVMVLGTVKFAEHEHDDVDDVDDIEDVEEVDADIETGEVVAPF